MKNVLVDYIHNWTPKVCDFGFARKSAGGSSLFLSLVYKPSLSALGKASRMTILGTEAYMAPELLFDEEYDLKADIFSYGIVLATILTRKCPESVLKSGDFLYRGPAAKFQLNFDEITENAEAGYPSMFLDLCLRVSKIDSQCPYLKILYIVLCL